MTLNDRMADAQQVIPTIVEVVERVKKPGDKVLVKYRVDKQYLMFPYDGESIVGYGKLLDYCSADTIVIGFPGSAAVECLLNDVRFYAFWDYRRYQANKYLWFDPEIFFLYVARTKEELYENIVSQRMYRSGYSKRDLLHEDGMYLHEIVSVILSKSGCKK